MTYAVPQPIRRSGKSNATGADRKREDLANDDPRTRTPSRSEEKDVDADESDHGLDNVLVITIRRTHDSNQELANQHPQGTPDEQRPTTKAFDGPERDWGGADVDEGCDQADEERIGNGAQLLEERGSEIEDEVDTGPLLHHLHRSPQNRPPEVRARLHETALEAIGPAAPVSALGNDLQFIFVIRDNLREFVLDEIGFDGLTSKPCEGLGCIVEFPALDEVTGGLGQKGDTGTQDQSPEHLNGDGDAVGARVHTVLSGIVDARGKEQANSNGELVAGDDGAADFLGAALGHVEDDDCGDEADAEASDETTGDEQAEAGRRGL